MPESHLDAHCTCTNISCPRHGDCKRCVIYHRDEMKNLPGCLRKPAELKPDEKRAE